MASKLARTLSAGKLMLNRRDFIRAGAVGLPEQLLFSVKRGAAISLDVVNDNCWPHAMHIHGHMVEHMAGGMATWVEVS